MAEVFARFLTVNWVDGHRVAEITGYPGYVGFMRIPHSIMDQQDMLFNLQYKIGTDATLVVWTTTEDMTYVKSSNYTNYMWNKISGASALAAGEGMLASIEGPLTGLRFDFGGTGTEPIRCRALF